MIENPQYRLGAEPEPQQEVRRQQRDVMAGGTIDPDEIATPKILRAKQRGCFSVSVRGMF